MCRRCADPKHPISSLKPSLAYMKYAALLLSSDLGHLEPARWLMLNLCG